MHEKAIFPRSLALAQLFCGTGIGARKEGRKKVPPSLDGLEEQIRARSLPFLLSPEFKRDLENVLGAFLFSRRIKLTRSPLPS